MPLQRAKSPPTSARRWTSAKKPKVAPTRASLGWKDVVGKFPTERAPRRELARVLRQAQSWAQLADALKDEEAKAAHSGADKAAVLLELAEIYGKLNNDNQVIAALNNAIQQDPSRPDASTIGSSRCTKRRSAGPISSRSSTTRPSARSMATEKVAIYLQVANLYLERFSNQAEAIKAFEKVLELDPNNAQAIDHLLAVYEKRRDWEKLIKLKEAEVERTPESERAAKVIEVARMAQTKVKKPDICTYWWEKVVQYEPTHEEALAELYKLYERNKEWDKLADICQRQADAALRRRRCAPMRCSASASSTPRRSRTARRRSRPGRSLLAIDENNRRAQDALKKLYVTESRWSDLEEFYRSRGKIDEYIRVLEREVESGAESQRLALAMKIAVLYRDELQKADRAMRAFEKVLQLDEHNLAAAEALIPLYEAGRDPKALVRVLEIQLRATPADEQITRQERMKRLAQYNEEKLRDKGAAFGWWIKALCRGSRVRGDPHRGRAARARHRRAGTARRRVRRRAAEVRRTSATRCRSMRVMAQRHRERAGRRRSRARDEPPDPRDRRAQRAGARRTRAAVPRQGPVRRAPRGLREEARPLERPDERIAIQ